MKHCDTSNALQEPKESRFARPNIYLAFLLATIALFYASTLRQGHLWADDFAMYVHHAENIVEGRPYADTGYIYSSTVPVSPRMYPPVFPLLLAPLYKFFGLNLMPMKLEQVFFFILTLVVVYVLWQHELGPGYGIALVAILGFSPAFWIAKDSVLSDLPFLLFFYLAAVLVGWAPRQAKNWWRWAVLLGLVTYLATGTRVAGIALIAGLVLYDLVHRRKVTRFTMLALLVWIILVMLQIHFVGPAQGSYTDHGHPALHTVLVNVRAHSRWLAGFWVASERNAFSFAALGIIAVLTLAGSLFVCRRGLTIVEAFLIPYVALVLLWPFPSGIRLMFPLIPWIVYVALTGLREVTARLAPRYTIVAACGLLLMISVSYVMSYRKMDFGPIRQDAGLSEFNQLCQQVRDHTGSGDVFLYYRARSLSLYTGRMASSYNSRGTQQELFQYFHGIHATYLITSNAFHEDEGFLDRYVQEHSSGLDLTYQNAHFSLYRIRSESAVVPERR